MVFGVPLLTNRVAPRCSAADSLLLVTVSGGRVTGRRVVEVPSGDSPEFVDLITGYGVGTLVCGGISGGTREAVESRAMTVVDNVACSAGEIVAALEAGALRPGFGFLEQPDELRTNPAEQMAGGMARPPDCLACSDRVCLRGELCASAPLPAARPSGAVRDTLDAAADIALEGERQLCRLAELVYFALEMDYQRIGVAFCVDLLEPSAILVGVLRRFFEVIPVCCKIGGRTVDDMIGGRDEELWVAGTTIACNPIDQARALNLAGTDLNVVVGLCVGADCVFNQTSEAPVTTLFVKDKSLANNPIGALYSEYYLRESMVGVSLAEPPTRRNDKEAT